jgi:hypothetical protein
MTRYLPLVEPAAADICPRAIMMIIPCWDRPALLIQIIKFLSNNIKRQQEQLQSLKRKEKQRCTNTHAILDSE